MGAAEPNSVTGWALYHSVTPSSKINQGDLISFNESTELLRRAGIIVTADCDIEQNKHARLITLVPVVSVKDILEHYLLVEDCEKKRDIIENYVFNFFDIRREQDRDLKISILREIVAAKTANQQDLMDAACEFVLEKSSSISVDNYKFLMKAIKVNPRKSDAIQNQIKSRGDLLVLPDLRALGAFGEIAWLRHIWQVPQSEIAIRTSEIKNRPGERVARLDSPYRYRLTQLMAQVFSDIGLPENHDNVEQAVREIYHAI